MSEERLFPTSEVLTYICRQLPPSKWEKPLTALGLKFKIEKVEAPEVSILLPRNLCKAKKDCTGKRTIRNLSFTETSKGIVRYVIAVKRAPTLYEITFNAEDLPEMIDLKNQLKKFEVWQMEHHLNSNLDD